MTKRFLRPLDLDRDIGALHEVFGDEESCRFMSSPATKNVEETHTKISAWYNQCPDTEWALIDEPEGACLGRVTMVPMGDDVFEAGVVVLPSARGRGLASRGLIEALQIVFEKMSARRVFADIDPENVASIKTFERLGFKKEGHLRATMKTHIGVRDTLLMSLIDRDEKPWL